MNAIKLRPRQVLCDKCKNSVVAEKKKLGKVVVQVTLLNMKIKNGEVKA